MTRRRRKRPSRAKRILLAILALPLVYGVAALIGALVPVNANWEEPDEGIPVYIASNGVHLDFILPASAGGRDWRGDFPPGDVGNPQWAAADWVMIGAGDRGIYLDTPTWADLELDTAAEAMVAGERVMHVQWVSAPEAYAVAALRLRPEEYRRLASAIRADFDLSAERLPQRIDHDGYWDSDAFYEGRGNFNAVRTCNQWVNAKLRIAGVEASLWTPFSTGLTWRFRPIPEGRE
ncbi:TIGR02117 family protein [Sphingomicrobium nitratireducens]|uniref:TIGR02117 family protein n=1 Tax=Sphingomicrobium nitratireducens TaxID=2964666 RepID=UPI00223F398B|nr:TIGR02117 family protein [Sphingomicrobium nitratireducens]